MPTKLDQLKDKLRELFQLDRPDLDFGFYRIMHAKQSEIDRFLDHDLLPQVQAGLATLKGNDSSELTDAIKQAQSLGVDPDTVPKVRDLRAKYGTPVDPVKTEDAIYSHLYRFFSRYYDSGDFISMRRYKEGVYAIPYEGEEVVLHWANKDQYYIKSSENLRDYTVKLAEGDDAPRLHFKLVEADIEKDNRKAADDKKRVFIFNPEKTEVLENEIVLGFEYRADPDASKQETAITACVDYVKAHTADFGPLAPRLLALRPTDKNKDRTLLEKHLSDYTSKNSMDYFIHKDLGGFLRRELDFYIKNEVMHLDDIENETAPRVEQYLAQVRVIRGIAHKLIDFLAQLEDFQKKLWLKKKFVVETNYCITLDRVPEELYPAIAANDAQWAEWDKLGFLVDQVNEVDTATSKSKSKAPELDLGTQTPAPEQGTVEYLKTNPYLVLDTAFFDATFKQKLLASIENIDEQCDGLLIHSENFQALELLQERYREQVKCVYIDPPYNTGEDGFPYKDSYKGSSWLSMFQDRLSASFPLLGYSGLLASHMDEHEHLALEWLIKQVFGDDGDMGKLIWDKRNPKGDAKGIAAQHEYVHFAVKNPDHLKQVPDAFARNKENAEAILAKAQQLIQKTGSVNEVVRKLFRDWVNGQQHFSGGEKAYCQIDEDGNVYRPVSMAWPNKQRAPHEYFIPLKHPVTGQDCPVPARGWRNPPDTMKKLIASGRILFGRDHATIPNSKYLLRENITETVASLYYMGSSDDSLFVDMGLAFENPKPVRTAQYFLSIMGRPYASLILDYFAGSGTTGHAVISLNREDEGKRKYILVEMGEHFDTVLKPRIQKVVYSKDWKDGKPLRDFASSRESSSPSSTGISHCFKYVRLESYEDCLNNLELKRTAGQDDLLNRNPAMKEDYTLRYMLDVESRDNLLNPAAFADPYACTLKIATGSVGETKPTTVDLVETFNYLIGLQVRTMDTIRGVQVITGENLAGDKILVLWRKVAETDSEALNQWFVKQGYNTQDMEFDIIYVNGDNFLENLRKDEQTWKVRLTEEEFLRRMFNEETGA